MQFIRSFTWLLIASLYLSSAAWAQANGKEVLPSSPPATRVVVKIFNQSITAADLGWDAQADINLVARELRARALRAAAERYIVAKKIAATPEDIRAFSLWDQEFKRRAVQRRSQRLTEIAAEIEVATDLATRQRLQQEQELLQRFAKIQEEHGARPLGPSTEQQAQRMWIEGHKLRKALYEQYGGRVGVTPLGPDPVGATEAWLREHEKARRLQIFDKKLSDAFWAAFAAEPRVPAKPEQIDFSYHWLKPVPMLQGTN